jgi:hypothetical protein
LLIYVNIILGGFEGNAKTNSIFFWTYIIIHYPHCTICI